MTSAASARVFVFSLLIGVIRNLDVLGKYSAVEMVELMADGTGKEVGDFFFVDVAVSVLSAEFNGLRASDIAVKLRETETALGTVLRFLTAFDYLWVDKLNKACSVL